MTARFIATLVVATSTLMAGCATVTAPPTSASAATGAERAFHQTIDLGGRLSVRYQAGRREESLHGSFTWSQTPSLTNVTLLSPLGQTIAVVSVTPEGATLTQAGQAVRSANNVNALTAETLGWPLPVAGLREWLQGFAVDRAGKRFTATPSSTDVTTPDGWRVQYAVWADDAAGGLQRPRRIDLNRPTEQAGDVSIRIVVDTWQPR